MKETDFIKENKDKWLSFEKQIQENDLDLDLLSQSYKHITDDLAYAKTHYKNRAIKLYLNNLVKLFNQKIYSKNTFSFKSIFSFWNNGLLRVCYQSRKEIRLSLIIFIIGLVIGVFSTIMESTFPSRILSDRYVEMTKSNIEHGDPMAVYKQMEPFEMFIKIGSNNLLVCFKVFIEGVFLAIGSLISLLFHGVMIGAFQTYFFQEGVVLESLLTIWMHGSIEVPCIVLSCAAGIVLGKGFLFPQSYTYVQSIKYHSVLALKLFVGLVPFIILAAIIESFITRFTDIPEILRALFIVIGLGFMVYYFWFLPKIRFNGEKINLQNYGNQLYFKPSEIDEKSPKTNSQIYSETFVLVTKYFKQNIGYSLLLTMILYIIYQLFNNVLIVDVNEVINKNTQMIKSILFIYNPNSNLWIFICSFIIFSIAIIFSIRLYDRKKIKKEVLISIFTLVLISLIINYLPIFFSSILYFFIIPIAIQLIVISYMNSFNIFKSLSFYFKNLKGIFGKSMMLNIAYYITFLLVIIIISFPLEFYIESFTTNSFTNINIEKTIRNINTFIEMFIVLFFIPFYLFGNILLYSSVKEVDTASHLLDEIDNLNIKRRAYGIEAE